jgi:hypothetical protein
MLRALHMLSAGEVRQHSEDFCRWFCSAFKATLPQDLPDELRRTLEAKIDDLISGGNAMEQIGEMVREVAEHSERNYQQKRNRKPEYAERDAEIVRLRGTGKSFKEIVKSLKTMNPDWELSDDAAEAAYRRARKQNQTATA